MQEIHPMLMDKDNHKAYILLTIIALRANRSTKAALIGDWQDWGFSKREYEQAKRRLAKLRLCKFQAIRGKGTVATLLTEDIFEI